MGAHLCLSFNINEKLQLSLTTVNNTVWKRKSLESLINVGFINLMEKSSLIHIFQLLQIKNRRIESITKF